MKPEVDALMRNYAGDVPGAAVLVLRDRQPVVPAGYGLADLETGTPATPETNYRLASVTKQFTAASILLLAEDGASSSTTAATSGCRRCRRPPRRSRFATC